MKEDTIFIVYPLILFEYFLILFEYFLNMRDCISNQKINMIERELSFLI